MIRKLLLACLLALGWALPADAAARVWFNGTGNFSDTAHWGTGSGGAGAPASVPGSGDTILMDAASCAGACTITIDQDITAQNWTWGACTNACTIDNSANHTVTLNTSGCMSGTGIGTRTFTGGTGTYTCSAVNATWNMGTITNLSNPTTAFASATVVFSGASTTGANYNSGTTKTGTFNCNACGNLTLAGSGNSTIDNFLITAPAVIQFPQANTTTITNAFAWTATSSNQIMIQSSNINGGTTTITTGSGTANTAQWAAFRSIVFTPVGGSTLAATNSFTLGQNSGTGFTITPPTVGSAHIIGSGF